MSNGTVRRVVAAWTRIKDAGYTMSNQVDLEEALDALESETEEGGDYGGENGQDDQGGETIRP